MKDVIKSIIRDFHSSQVKESFPRRIKLPINAKTIISVIGVRRSGKTYLLFNTIKQLIENGINIEKILYVNFEDERLDLGVDNLDLLLQSYMELYPEHNLESCYFFFDEIQNVNGWEKFIRRVYDTVSTNIYITGSNSKLLSTEIATSLRGRTITYTLYPLSFKEFLSFNGIYDSYHGTKQRIKVINNYEQFLRYGGFPELIDLPEDLRIRKLQNYFDTIIYKDLIERYEVRHPTILKYFLKKILVQITKPLSVNRIYNELKSQGYKISNNLLYEYLDYINSTFTAILIPKFDFSEIKQLKSEKKAYAIDNGILTATNFSYSNNYGALLENMIALEFLKYELDITYFKNNLECDFIVKVNSNFYPVQVSYTFDYSGTIDREINGVIKACKYVNNKYGLIITNDYENKIEKDNITIELVPAYKYMLDMEKYFL